MKHATLNLTPPGWVALTAICLLLAVGVATIYVTDTHYAAGHDGPHNAAKQCIFALAGLLVAAVVLKIGYHEISRYAYPIFLVALLGLLFLLIARLLHTDFGGLTKPINGAYRWIRLPGFQLQPSEFMKIAYVIALAWYLRYRENYRRFRGLLLPLAISVVPSVLILLEPDLGTVLLLLPVLFAMLFMAGARISHLVIVLLIGVAAMPFAWHQIEGYQRMRVTAVLLQSDTLRQAVVAEPDKYKTLVQSKRDAIEWAASSGYQLVHSKNALGSGGLFGQGWGQGVYVTSPLLPDRHNDFILAIIGHQWGFAGCLLALCCYAAIVLAAVRVAMVTSDPFGRLLAIGVAVLFATQVIINAGMSVGLMPITGMTLPFVSYGGSSLLCNFIAIALLISVSQRRPYLLASKPFEFAPRRKTPPVKLHDYADGLPTIAGPVKPRRPKEVGVETQGNEPNEVHP